MEAVERVKDFLDQRDRMRGLDLELIYSVQSNPDGEAAELRTSDLRALLEMVDSREAEIKQAYLDGANRADAQWTKAVERGSGK